MSLASLKKALERKITDDFQVGTVIRWTSSGKYVYTAVKSPVGWFTSAAEYNRFVPQVVTFDELLKILGRSETTDVAVASDWVSVG